MLAFRRPYDLALAFAAGVFATGLGFAAAPVVAPSLGGRVQRVAFGELSPVVVDAIPELASPDSIAAMLVSGPDTRRRETRALLSIVADLGYDHSASAYVSTLEEIVDFESLDSAVVSALARAMGRVSSASTRERLLRTLIRRQPHAVEGSRRAVLEVIGTTRSTSDRVATLELFLTRPGLSQAALVNGLNQIGRVPAEDYRSRALVSTARANRIQGNARRVYLDIANRIRSSRDRTRALAALGLRVSQKEGGPD